MVVDAYPKRLCATTPLSFFEVVCSETGKNIMPPINLDLCTNASQFFRRTFDRMRQSILNTGVIAQVGDLTDDEIFQVCFADRERLPVFKIILVDQSDDELVVTHRSEQALDWELFTKGFVVCNYGSKLKQVYKQYATTLVKLQSEPVCITRKPRTLQSIIDWYLSGRTYRAVNKCPGCHKTMSLCGVKVTHWPQSTFMTLQRVEIVAGVPVVNEREVQIPL